MSDDKKVVSTDTDEDTKIVPLEDGSVQKVTTITTKTKYSDGSSSTKVQTRTEREVIRQICTQTKTLITSTTKNPAIQALESGNGNHSHTSSSSSDSDSDSEDFSKFQQEALQAHSEYRKRHGVQPLKLSKKICKISQNWANTIAAKGDLEHSRGTGYGENVLWTKGEIKHGNVPVDTWYNEIKEYKFGSPNYQPGTGHFTQVVWKDSTEFGIGKAFNGDGTFVVANYSPAGNFQGQFSQNVLTPNK